MKVGELFVDDKTKSAATEYAVRLAIDNEFLKDHIDDLRDAFIAGVAWKQLKERNK